MVIGYRKLQFFISVFYSSERKNDHTNDNSYEYGFLKGP